MTYLKEEKQRKKKMPDIRMIEQVRGKSPSSDKWASFTPDLPIDEKLTDIIQKIKDITGSYRKNIEIKVVEDSNKTNFVELKILFLL